MTRYLFGFACVCALGLLPLVGCSEGGGEGGSGGTAGSGGTGGMPECQCDFGSDCLRGGACRVLSCVGEDDETPCIWTFIGSGWYPGLCVGGTCERAVEDCTGQEDSTACSAFDGAEAYCRLEQCATNECTGLEDRTYCVFAVLGDGTLGVCETGKCTKPEDCAGLVDGWDCLDVEVGVCEGGECITAP